MFRSSTCEHPEWFWRLELQAGRSRKRTTLKFQTKKHDMCQCNSEVKILLFELRWFSKVFLLGREETPIPKNLQTRDAMHKHLTRQHVPVFAPCARMNPGQRK